MALAARFKAACAKALAVTEGWLDKQPVRHIKNRFDTSSKHGCEDYAYFDKYMITVASNLYAAYLVCDESIPSSETADRAPCVAATTAHFHKLFLKCGGYGLEFDLDADPCYDSCGLGRIHYEGAPTALCLSCPCPAEPLYTLHEAQPMAFSLCSAVRQDGKWHFGAESGSAYSVLNTDRGTDRVSADLLCVFGNGRTVEERYTACENGVSVCLAGQGEIGFALPVFYFDGEEFTHIFVERDSVTVLYDGWSCRYTTDGAVVDMDRTVANRNGYYRAYVATATDRLKVDIEIKRA